MVIESVTGAVTQQERDRGRHFQLSSTLNFNFQCSQFSTKIVNLANLQYTTARCPPLIFPRQSSRSAQRCISTEIFNLGNLHHCPSLIFPWHSSCCISKFILQWNNSCQDMLHLNNEIHFQQCPGCIRREWIFNPLHIFSLFLLSTQWSFQLRVLRLGAFQICSCWI